MQETSAVHAGMREGCPSEFRSAAWQATQRKLTLFARDDTAPVLLVGESGSGKTWWARHVHEMSPRAKGPYQHVVLSTLEDSLASSELFGHVPGAFTDARYSRAGHFASASGGTLFLDEIGKASLTLQGKLLHAIEYNEIRPVGSDRQIRVSARIITATNVDLGELVDAGKFLPDLFARLATFRVELPPLRKRRADIPVLVLASVARHALAAGYSRPPTIDEALMSTFVRAPWPNNLRELDATVHRLLIEADGASCIGLAHCIDELSAFATPRGSPKQLTSEQVEVAIQRAGTISGAARHLGIDRKTLRLMRRRKES